MSDVAQIAPRTGGRLLNGRTLLWCAWTVPSLLTITRLSSVLDITTAAAVTAGLAGVLTFLPTRFWRVLCAISVLALPFTIWWCGAATVGGAGPGYEAAVAAMLTNPSEAHGAFSVVVAYPPFLVAVAGHLVFLFLACRAALGYGPVEAGQAAHGPWVKSALLASVLPLTLVSLLSMQDGGQRDVPLFGAASLASPLGSLEEIVQHKIRVLAWYHEEGYRRRAAQPTMHITQPTLAMFVVGESARADGYGPNRASFGPASKRLAERIDSGLGSWLPNTCASSNGTHLSVPLLLTNTRPADRDNAPTAPTILGILHADGFSTAWLANNEAGPDAREAGHNLYAGAFRINPEKFLWDEVQKWRLDEDAVPVAKHFAGNVDRPKAMILHFMGNHFPYENRYRHELFPPEPAELSKQERTQLRYERSLEYGARTILELADILDSTTAPAFLVFTSDHGENLPGDPAGFILHMGPRTTQADGTVPSFALWNRAMADTGRPAQAVSKLVHAKQIAHVDVAELFLALAGVAPVPVEPTPNPTIWGKISVGDGYAAVPCSALKP
jgi:glucan phosphoethanolaminetransferase (alkaline phosphatase superfamily)